MKANLLSLRPTNLNEFIGKPEIVRSLRIGIEVAKKLKKPLEHTLIYGPPGVGKTSLAHIISNEMKVNLKIVPSINIQTLPDLIGVLNSLNDFDILFIDEIHSLKLEYSEMLYSALEDNVLDLLIGKNYNSKTIRVNLPKFTLIAATTNLGALPKALEERFGYIFFIDCYTEEELIALIKRVIDLWKISLSEEEIKIIVSNSRGIPRNANRILRRVLDYKTINNKCEIQEIIKECGFVYMGLTETDIKYLAFLKNSLNFTSGIKSIIQGTNIDESTLLKKIEPYLVWKGFISKTNRGRMLTSKGEKILNNYKKWRNKTIK